MKEIQDIRLTQFSHGSGCGCKIAPAMLEKILQQNSAAAHFPQLLVGNESKDDAAVYELADGQCIISTTDFFMPIVDDAYTFGAIASVNALSDVYAMGGTPIMALAILGWPIDKLGADIAQQVLNGSRRICERAGIPLAGGHSIDSPEPIFGLAVTGTVRKEHLKKNNTAKAGDLLLLTKPIGVGMVTTAQKRGVALTSDMHEAIQVMTKLNTIGTALGKMPYVHALTDVTGFGLLGHLLEVCEGSGLSAEITYSKIPKLSNLSHYASAMIYPDNTMRNWQSYESRIKGIGPESLLTLCDPQTSGGLLICVDPNHLGEMMNFLDASGMVIEPFGRLKAEQPAAVTILPE